MRVAILGTGKMGGEMAKRLHDTGHDVVVWNRTRSRAEALGVGKVASTPAEAAGEAEIVISILTDADALRSAYLGDGGAASAARDQVFVEMSTAGPDVIDEMRPAVERAGAKFIESPVMGSVPQITAGKLLLFAAGDDTAMERAAPVFQSLGEVRRMKDAETAAKVKLIANTTLMMVNALAAELLAAGEAAGVDRETVFALLTRFVPYLDNRRAGFMEHRFEPVTFAVRDALKDLKLAHDVYRRAAAETPLTETAIGVYERATKTVGDLDVTAITTVYEKEPTRSKR
jgi:3-hydroxyisobutyrate dehydrogenase-like beta-hydroxyacid dehydrogenase